MNPELLQKYIAGNATEAEKQRVTKWIQENPENMREYRKVLLKTVTKKSKVGGCSCEEIYKGGNNYVTAGNDKSGRNYF